MTGVLYGVGVGPGDPELLTVKAINAIGAADIIIAPRSEKTDDSTTLAIARPFLKTAARIVPMVFPMVSDRQTLDEAWEANRRVICAELDEGRTVAFLTLGDPMLYSTYIYVFRLIEEAGYPIQTIPGIPSFCAIGSRMGYPLVEGDEVLSVVPATITEERMDQILAMSDNVVLMKVYKNSDQVIQKLEHHGLAENAVMVSRCGLDQEKMVRDIANVRNQRLNYLTTILARKRRL